MDDKDKRGKIEKEMKKWIKKSAREWKLRNGKTKREARTRKGERGRGRGSEDEDEEARTTKRKR